MDVVPGDVAAFPRLPCRGLPVARLRNGGLLLEIAGANDDEFLRLKVVAYRFGYLGGS